MRCFCIPFEDTFKQDRLLPATSISQLTSMKVVTNQKKYCRRLATILEYSVLASYLIFGKLKE